MLPSDWIQQIRSSYPKRCGSQGWGHMETSVPRLVKSGKSFEEILAGVKRYAVFTDATHQTGSVWVMQASKFFGPGKYWQEDYDLPSDGSVDLSLDQIADKLGLKRTEGELDESFSVRVGIAQTKLIYAEGSK